MAQILVVDDEVGIRELLSEILADEGHAIQLAENATQAREARLRGRPDLVLLDIWMPDADGITLLKEWAANGQLSMPVVMMSGHATIDTAVEATRIGALDFLEKPIALQKLLTTVKRALTQHDQRATKSTSIANIGKSPSLVELRRRLHQAASSRSSVLLRGEHGAMPEVYARLLHQAGTPWVNASASLGQTSLDLQQQAAGGVLFIEDLARLSANQQKHLAFIAGLAEKMRLRLVSFSSEGPRRLAENRGFDPVLVSRLSELVFAIPPVREHLSDVPEIAGVLLGQLVEARFCSLRRFSADALEALAAFDWPGNLEDLSAAVRTLAVGAASHEITRAEVTEVLKQFARENTSQVLGLNLPLREAREAFERAYFEHHIALEGGSIAKVAEKSGLERTHLYRKLKALGISTGRKDGDA